MPITVPQVDAGPTPSEGTPGARPPVMHDTPENKLGRTAQLARVLAATKGLPADQRAALQMQLLAYPEAWHDGQWENPDLKIEDDGRITTPQSPPA